MHKAERRELLVEVLRLIAAIEEEAPNGVYGASRAAMLVCQGRDSEALAALRESTSGAVAAVDRLLETHLLGEEWN